MTDREDLDDQIWRTFIGCGVTDEKTPRAGSGKELQEILRGNHRFVFSLIHKFNQPVTEPYSERDDIIVISDEAHRTQAGKFARNMRLALPNASFIGFTGTPLFKHDELTRRIFGDYVSRYDFKRSEEDQSTVKLVYENRGEKLGHRPPRPERPDRRRDRGGRARSRPDGAAREAARQGLRGHHGRRPARQAGRRLRRALLHPLGDRQVDAGLHRQDHLRADVPAHRAPLAGQARRGRGTHPRQGERSWRPPRIRTSESASPRSSSPCAVRPQWMESTIIEIVISEAQNEVRDFQKWGFDIIPHRVVMKTGLRDARRQAGAGGRRLQGPAASRSASPSSARCG